MARPANARLGTLQTPFRCLQTAYPRLDVFLFLLVSLCRLNTTPVGLVSQTPPKDLRCTSCSQCAEVLRQVPTADSNSVEMAGIRSNMGKLLVRIEQGVFDESTSSTSRDSTKEQRRRWIVDIIRWKHSRKADKPDQILHTDTSHTGVIFRALPSCRT